MKVKTLNYFQTSKNQVVYPASTWKRFFARILDLVFAVAIGSSLITWQLHPGRHSQKATDVAINAPEISAIVWTGWVLNLVGLIIFFYIIPIFNKKNPGQTVGKYIMGITPLYLNDSKVWKAIIIREIPWTLLYMLPIIFTMMTSNEAGFLYAQFSRLVALHRKNDIGEWTKVPSRFEWLNVYSRDARYGGLNMFQIVMTWFAWISNYIMLFAYPILWLSILFSPLRRGAHDHMASTAVVDLRTLMTKTDADKMTKRIIEGKDVTQPKKKTKKGEPPVDLKTK